MTTPHGRDHRRAAAHQLQAGWPRAVFHVGRRDRARDDALPRALPAISPPRSPRRPRWPSQNSRLYSRTSRPCSRASCRPRSPRSSRGIRPPRATPSASPTSPWRSPTAVDRADGGPFRDLRFSPDEMKEIRYASLLHDFGKVGVREEVLVKAKKLYPWASSTSSGSARDHPARVSSSATARRKIDWLLLRRRASALRQRSAEWDAELAAALARDRPAPQGRRGGQRAHRDAARTSPPRSSTSPLHAFLDHLGEPADA